MLPLSARKFRPCAGAHYRRYTARTQERARAATAAKFHFSLYFHLSKNRPLFIFVSSGGIEYRNDAYIAIITH